MKKTRISGILIIVAILFLGIGFLFLGKGRNQSLEKSKWKILEGNDFQPKNLIEYEENEFYSLSFNSTDSSNKTKYSFAAPQNATFSYITKSNTLLSDNTLLISYETKSIPEINDYIKEEISNLKKEYDNVFIEKKEYLLQNVDMTVLHEKFAKEKNYQEKIIFLAKNDTTYYSKLEYQLLNYKMKDSFIEEIIKRFTPISKDSIYNNCEKKTCTFDFSNVKGIDSKIMVKYDSDGFYEFATEKLNNYSAMLIKTDKNDLITDVVQYQILESLGENLKTIIDRDNDNITPTSIEINNLSYLKYEYPYEIETKTYKANYYYFINDNLAINISLNLKEKSLDEEAIHLMNIEISTNERE